MSDIFTPTKRHEIMSSIKGSNTKPEILVRKFLYNNGFRFRRNVRTLPGSPDIVIKKIHTVIFINGCFWHGHQNCKAFRIPKTRTEFWIQKIQRNRERDKEAIKKLQTLGWDCIVVWECQLKPGRRKVTLEKLLDVLYDIYLDSSRL